MINPLANVLLPYPFLLVGLVLLTYGTNISNVYFIAVGIFLTFYGLFIAVRNVTIIRRIENLNHQIKYGENLPI